MAFKAVSTTGNGKRYLFLGAYFAQNLKEWVYVTTDAPTTVEVSGYFADVEAEALMTPGDRLWVYQVAAIDDTRTIQDDIGAGLSDVSMHIVVASDGSGINVTPDLLSATITYTS
jgi:hypothetical protein